MTDSVRHSPLSVVAALALLGACDRGGDTAATTTATAASVPTLVFSDDFERDTFGAHWSTTSEAWSLVDGEVHVAGARNEGLWLTEPLPENVRISFDARALSEEGDIKFEVFTDGATHQSGYVGIFGGWDNQLNIIARLDEHGDDRLVGAQGRYVELERNYTLTIERTDQRVQWSIDGEPFITYDDPEPLRGEGHEYFGFNDWDSPVRFDNLKVWDLGEGS